MKKFGLLCLALVMALGVLGVGYAAWTDTITIDGTVNTGEVSFSVDPGSYHEVGGCPDQQWTDWVKNTYPGGVSCPDGYHFTGIGSLPPPEDKCVADVTITPVYDDDNNIIELDVVIDDAYPYLLVDISFWVCNTGTIPIKIKAPVFKQSDFLLIQYGDNIGRQLHPDECVEISFRVGVTQHQGYFGGPFGYWIVDDESYPTTPQDDTLSFTITIEAVQWNEY